MTLTIDVSPATLEQLKAEAAATGKDIQTIVREAVEARFARRQTLAEILKPIHDEVEASGISEHELEAMADASVSPSARSSSQECRRSLAS